MAERKKRSEALTRERMESEALVLVEQDGLDGFSTRRLAERLGCQAMSLYHHYPSKAHLLDAMLDRVIRSAPLPPADQAWDARLAAIARDFRRVALAHPRFFPFMATHRMNTPAGLRWLETVLSAFRDAGLGEETAARLFRVFGYFLMGAGLDETAGYSAGPTAAEPVAMDEFPHVLAAGRYFQPAAREATFELGLAGIIDMVRRAAAQAKA